MRLSRELPEYDRELFKKYFVDKANAETKYKKLTSEEYQILFNDLLFRTEYPPYIKIGEAFFKLYQYSKADDLMEIKPVFDEDLLLDDIDYFNLEIEMQDTIISTALCGKSQPILYPITKENIADMAGMNKSERIKYYLKHRIDFQDLIGKGIALDANDYKHIIWY